MKIGKAVTKHWKRGVVVLVLVGILFLFDSGAGDKQEDSVEVQGPTVLGNQTIERNYSFSVKDEKQKKVGEVEYSVERVEKVDEILVQGKPARAVEGKAFLIVRLKIVNETDQLIEMDPRTYVRLIIGGREDELIAPDIHNGPLELQAISTLRTQIGFSVDSEETSFVLQVGEVEGDKDRIEVVLE